jgi:hypothetical protein
MIEIALGIILAVFALATIRVWLPLLLYGALMALALGAVGFVLLLFEVT